MTIYGYVLPGAVSIARSTSLAGKLGAKAKGRLKILDWHHTHDQNLSLTARRFGVSRRLLREWRDRLVKEGPQGLEDKSKRPHTVRQSTTAPDVVAEVVKWRRKYPAWSKYKIQPLLPAGLTASVSTVGRILKRRNLIDRRISRKRSKSARHPKARFPRGMKISSPGDMVQMDTKYIMLPGGKKWYQFTAIDVLTKQRMLRVYSSQSSRNGARFLKECVASFPFSIKTVQTDNGAPFLKEFEKLCQELGLPHYFIYPRTPKQNSYVEISHGADEREFYRQGNVCFDFATMRKRLKEWQDVWNNLRPHQALNYLTPNQYLKSRQNSRLPTKDVITLQT